MSDTLPASFIELLSALVRQPSVVGAEHAFFRVLQRELEDRGAHVTWYEGLLVAQGSNPSSLYLSAHIDRHGLMCTGPNEFQYAAFVAGARSDLLGNSVSELLMRKVAERFQQQAVFAYEPWSGAYRGQGMIESCYVCEFRNNLIFKVSGLDHLVAGTPVAFYDRLRVSEGALAAQLDNVLTAAGLIYLFEQGFTGTCFFTAQEEAGKSWRYLLEWFRRFGASTNQLIVVDTSPFPSFESAQQQHLVLRNKDANASFNLALTEHLHGVCEQLQLSTLFKDRFVEEQNAQLEQQGLALQSLGSTELGRIIAASNGLVDGTTLQIPTSGYHTMEETAPTASVMAFLSVLKKLAQLS
ncbi:peptidase M42 [Bermanella sp. R86510]|uniref:peptidase M42 n=1 Tax=unclassified Bermanella TaxID=2627862 RepID=UPI0037CC082E